MVASCIAEPREAEAADVGEIALVPDVGGMINGSVFAPNVYLGRTACAFLQDHPDRFDAIFVFTSIQLNALTRVQQGWPVRQAATGIGRDVFLDTSRTFCSSRLRQAVKMSDIDSFDDDPDRRYGGIILFPLTGIQLLAHEFGHHWMSSIRFNKGDGVTHCMARGFEPRSGMGTQGECDGYAEEDFNQHWSYYFNSGSVMYGNTIADLGGGQFMLSNPMPKYSPLDQYLMGLRDPNEVPPMFVVDVGDVAGVGSASLPLSSSRTEMKSGTRVDFTIDDVIRAEGPRVPPREGCHWKGAFIIVHEENTPPTAAQIARVDAYRRRWEGFYADATDRRGSFDTTLAGAGAGTVECPAPAQPPPADAGVRPDSGRADATVALDSGVAPRDADPLPDASASPPDAGLADAIAADPDSGVRPDAVVLVLADSGPGQDPTPEEAKAIEVDDCGCRAVHGARGASPLGLVVLALIALRRRRRST